MLVRRLVTVVVVCSLSLGVASCDEEEPTPRFAEPTSAAPSPTETASEPPERESAEDFIRRWVEAERAMENTGETLAYRELSRDCQACLDLADTIARYYQAGGHVKWAGWGIRSIRRDRAYGPHAYRVDVVSAPTEYVTKAGASVQRLAGGPAVHLLRLQPTGPTWTVADKSELPG